MIPSSTTAAPCPALRTTSAPRCTDDDGGISNATVRSTVVTPPGIRENLPGLAGSGCDGKWNKGRQGPRCLQDTAQPVRNDVEVRTVHDDDVNVNFVKIQSSSLPEELLL